MTVILYLIALVLFVLAAFHAHIGSIGLEPLGLAFLAAAFLLGAAPWPWPQR